MQKMHENIDRVSTDELSAFIAVVETHSFTEASKVIGRDATIVSRRIAQLESRLGVRLFARTTRNVTLTEVGTLYYQRVRSLLDALDSASQEASDFASSPQGLLRVSLPVTFGRRWIAPLLSNFITEFPKIKIDARFTDRYVDVVAEGFDVAIRVGMLRDSSLVAKKIASFQNRLYASPKYIAQYGIPSCPEELNSHSCLGFTSYKNWPDWVLERNGVRKTIRLNSPLVADNSEALLQAAIDNIGIILTPDWLAGKAVNNGTLINILSEWKGAEEGGIYAVMPPGRLVPIKTRVFVDTIAGAIREGWM